MIDRSLIFTDAIGERSLITGEPIFGNIISAVRRRRKKIAWTDNMVENQSITSSSSSSSGDSNRLSRISSAKKFPSTLPQHHIDDLELGVIGGVGSSSSDSCELHLKNMSDDSTSRNNDVTILLEAARKWRMNANQHKKFS